MRHSLISFLSPFKLAVILGGIGIGAAIGISPIATAEAADSFSGDAPLQLRVVKPAVCPQIATEKQAKGLLTRLMPAAEFLSFEPFPLDDAKSVCLLEVEMFADRNNKQTRGFVYVLPDGKQFLNGPLMDKRSRMMVIDNSNSPASIPEASALSNNDTESDVAASSSLLPNEGRESLAVSGYSPISTPPKNSTPQIAQDASGSLRESLLIKLEKLPHIQKGQPNGRDVYVLFDPQCKYCHKLYDQYESVAQRLNLRFNWIPMFLNEQSWAMSAFLLKTAKRSPGEASVLFDKMMQTKWSAIEDAEQISGLSPEDYEYAKPSAMAFYELSKNDPTIGTPLVVFRTPKGSVDVISGVPNDMDWLPFVNVVKVDDSPSQPGK